MSERTAPSCSPAVLSDLRSLVVAVQRVEGVVVIAAADRVAGLKAADSANARSPVGSRGQAARILRDSGSEQRQISKPPSIQGQFVDGTVTLSFTPATPSLNSSSVVPSTCRRGVVCGDIPGDSTRSERIRP